MKKLITLFITAILGVACCFGLTACGNDNAKDWEYIQGKGNMVIGYTLYDPFAYEEDSQLVGFDVELAKAVASKLGITATFQIINWNAKVTEINAKNIDVIWNAMTISDELKKSIDISSAYCKNNQAIVVKSGSEATYATKELIKNSGKKIALEDGSSGAAAIESDSVLKTVGTTKCDSQMAALQEVAAGTSEIAVVDVLLYDALKTKSDSIVNTYNLVKVSGIEFEAELFGIGFRKGSNFMAKVEEAIATLKTEGVYSALAAKYNLTNNMVD